MLNDVTYKVMLGFVFVCFILCDGYIQSETGGFTTAVPTLVTKGATFRVVVGETLELPCVIRQLGPYVILWRRKNVILTAHYLLVTRDPRYSLVNGFNLQITNITPKDAGEYGCQIADIKSGDVIHKVEVLVPPNVRAVPIAGQLTTHKGGNVTLECQASGNPAPNVSWIRKKNGVSQNGQTMKGVTMTLEKVDRHHAGIYKCIADNGVGDPASLDVNLDVLYPPEVELSSPAYAQHEDATIELTCIVHGNPRPNVLWYLDGLLLTGLKRYHTRFNGNIYSLKIENIQGSDFGNFSCESENSLGKTRKFIQLTGTPMRPNFLGSPYSHTTGSYNLTWVVQSFAPISEVRLLYRKLLINESYQEPGNWQEVLLRTNGGGIFSQQMAYNIDGLETSSVFQALLQVRNRFGWSEESDLYQFYTRGPSEEIYELNIMDMELTSKSPRITNFGAHVLVWLILYLIFCSR